MNFIKNIFYLPLTRLALTCFSPTRLFFSKLNIKIQTFKLLPFATTFFILLFCSNAFSKTLTCKGVFSSIVTKVQITVLQKKAKQGDREAQFKLGLAYIKNKENDPDYKEASRWLYEAIEQGHALAEFHLRDLAKQGYAEAEFRFGLYYYNRREPGKDDENSFKAQLWLRRAVKKNHLDALFYFGKIHEVEPYKDFYKALRSYENASKRGHSQAHSRLQELATKETSQDAQFILGELYYAGEGVPQDFAEAAKWFTLATNQGHVGAQFKLGLMYYHGEGVPRNHKIAFEWFDKARDNGHPEAQNRPDLIKEQELLEAEQKAEQVVEQETKQEVEQNSDQKADDKRWMFFYRR